jgi:hypothetical protein
LSKASQFAFLRALCGKNAVLRLLTTGTALNIRTHATATCPELVSAATPQAQALTPQEC